MEQPDQGDPAVCFVGLARVVIGALLEQGWRPGSRPLQQSIEVIAEPVDLMLNLIEGPVPLSVALAGCREHHGQHGAEADPQDKNAYQVEDHRTCTSEVGACSWSTRWMVVRETR